MAFLIEQCSFCELTEDVINSCQYFSCGNNKSGCRFIIVDAVNDPKVIAFYQKNGFQMLFSSEQQELAYTVGKNSTITSLGTRLMYFDLLNML